MSAPPRMDRRIRERRRSVERARVRRRRRVVASVLAGALLAAGAVAATYTPLFAVVDVDVVGAAGAHEQEVRAAAGVEPGERLLGVDLEQVAADVEALPWVRSAATARRAPSTVAIAVTPREPVAVVRTGAESWLVDADGIVVAGGAVDGVVRIDAPDADLPASGEPVAEPAVRNALDAHLGLPPELAAEVVRYDAASVRGLRALLAADGLDAAGDGVWVRLGTAERLEDKALVVDLLLDQLEEHADRLGDTPIAELDVRAPDNPVVVPQS